MSPFCLLPATCELCGQWIPKHDGNCPRNGVHPSQWSASHPAESASHHHLDDWRPSDFNPRSLLHDLDDSDCHLFLSLPTLSPVMQ